MTIDIDDMAQTKRVTLYIHARITPMLTPWDRAIEIDLYDRTLPPNGDDYLLLGKHVVDVPIPSGERVEDAVKRLIRRAEEIEIGSKIKADKIRRQAEALGDGQL